MRRSSYPQQPTRSRGGSRRDQWGNIIPGTGAPKAAANNLSLDAPGGLTLSAGHDWTGFESAFGRPSADMTKPAGSWADTAASDLSAAAAGKSIVAPPAETQQAAGSMSLSRESQQRAVQNSLATTGNRNQRHGEAAIAASPHPPATDPNAVGNIKAADPASQRNPDGTAAASPESMLAFNQRLYSAGGTGAFARSTTPVAMTTPGQAALESTVAAPNPAPFRGSTTDEVRDFYASDPNRQDNNGALTAAAGTGAMVRSQYGTASSSMPLAGASPAAAHNDITGNANPGIVATPAAVPHPAASVVAPAPVTPSPHQSDFMAGIGSLMRSEGPAVTRGGPQPLRMIPRGGGPAQIATDTGGSVGSAIQQLTPGAVPPPAGIIRQPQRPIADVPNSLARPGVETFGNQPEGAMARTTNPIAMPVQKPVSVDDEEARRRASAGI